MQTIIAIITMVTTLLPLMKETIAAVEKMFPEGGQGAQKLAMVLGIVQNAIDVSGELQDAAPKIMPMVSGIVSSIVAIANATGQFKKSIG